MFIRFDSVVYFVSDIDAAAKWYSEVTNCEVKYENESYAYLELESGKIGFHPVDEKSGKNNFGQTVYWHVSSISEAIHDLTKKGASIYRNPIETDLGEFACMLTDPFGNSFGLISNKK
ncbi:hypothetical protein MNBD_GAMMA20-1844 [hydrothermal vent metagenome]|uniref:VOC domain-containing protein n=1 Tax=hydrothermal vent metagenome TaxID=652676 RepID=A0A3B1AMQ7_9ZZZZ